MIRNRLVPRMLRIMAEAIVPDVGAKRRVDPSHRDAQAGTTRSQPVVGQVSGPRRS